MKLILLFLLIFTNSYAQVEEEYVFSSVLFANEGENLKQLVDREIGLSFVTSREPWEKWHERIKKLNPKLNLNYLAKDEQVMIKVPKEKIYYKEKKVENLGEYFDPNRNKQDYISFVSPGEKDTSFFATDINADSQTNYLFKEVKIEPDPVEPIKQSLGIFYMGSKGAFKETTTNDISVSSNQNSPVSLGVSYAWIKEYYKYNGSIYFSYLNPGTTVGTSVSENISIPVEWGASIYYNNKRRVIFEPIFMGMDIERFSTFNIDELPLGESLDTRQHTISYVTIGYDFVTSISKSSLLLKASVAKSLFATSSRESLASSENFSGWRYLFYANYRLKNSHVFFHGLYKYHQLEGPTTLVIQRLGAGVGYSFF